jgi:Prenyltransferase and squalene oxidase repeat
MPTMSPRLAQAADFLKARQNPDGGWGYAAGRNSLVEPTGLCTIVLRARGAAAEAARGLAFLRSCQRPSGAVGIGPRDQDGGWMAYAALLAFHVLGAIEEERRLRDWVLSFEDASALFLVDRDAVKAISERYRYDPTIPGWSWTPRTTAWVEPTALFIIALRGVGVPASEKRVKSGLALILDRRVPSGGWNFGNPFSKSFELEASTMSTALALAALGAAGFSAGQAAVAAGLRYLKTALAGGVSTASLAWSLLALKSFPAAAADVPAVAERLARLQAGDGGFRGNPFETALAALVLSDDPALVPAKGGAS